MFLAFRKKTGCRQYIFDDLRQLKKRFSRKNYKGEYFRIQQYENNRFVIEKIFHYDELHDIELDF